MNVLLILFVLQGDAHTLAVKADSPADCIQMQKTINVWLPQLVREKIDYVAASCAEVKAFVREA